MRHLSAGQILKGIVALLFVTCVCLAIAGDVQVWAFITSSAGDTPRSTIPADTPKIWVIFETKGAKRGDKFRGVLIADHAGHIAPANSKITEGKATLDGDTKAGGLSFSRPINDWPIGDYHVDIYINDRLAFTVKFEVETVRQKSEDERE